MENQFNLNKQKIESPKDSSVSIRVGEEKVWGNKHDFTLYDKENQPCGQVVVAFNEGARSAQLDSIYIDSALQGRGLGKEIYKTIADSLTQKGFDFVSSPIHSPEAGRVWESLVKEGVAECTNGRYIVRASKTV